MTSKTFHPFPRLPRELRDEVWEFAVLSLPRRGRAHFFTLFVAEDKAALAASAEPVVMCSPGPNDCSWYHLAAPQCSGPGRLSWIDSNPSAYLCEIGLWGACKESREIMQKRFMPINWFDWGHFPEGSPEVDQFPALGAFSWNGQCQKFTVYPQSDLLCLQPFNFDNIDWEDLVLPISSREMGMGHMALVYDPEWNLLLDGRLRPSYPHLDETGPLGCIARAASNLCNARALWFIDYRIHRRPGTIPEANRKEFYGNSCKYVEVLPSDTSWEMDDEIFDFLRDLDDLLDDYYEELDDEYDGYESERPEMSSYRVGQPRIGVLACEKEER